MSLTLGLNIDGNEMKEINKKISINYTARDYESIKENLIDSIEDLTEKWTSRDESDPGIVLIKLMAQFGDLMSYNLDRQILEIFPNSVTQRKNAQQLYQLLGYKMRWYKSAQCEAKIVNTYQESATLYPFSQFTTVNDQIAYTNIEQLELPSNSSNTGIEKQITLIQGIPRTPTKKPNMTVPGPNKLWHDIYNYNVDTNNIVDNKIYIATKEIDQDHIILIDSTNETWTLVDSVATQLNVGKFFELRIDEYDRPYLYLVNYWRNYNITGFKLFYIQSLGEAGQIQANTLVNVKSPIYSTTGPLEALKVYNVASYVKISNDASTYGYYPETPDEAREEATKYVNTANTLVTLDDFTRFVMRLDGVANCLATDVTNDPGTTENTYYGDLNGDGVVDILDRDILQLYVDDPYKNALTERQYKLADLNGDGKVNADDLVLFNYFINNEMDKSGRCGTPVTLNTPLDDLTVKIYIAPIDELMNIGEARKLEYLSAIESEIRDQNHIALTVIPTIDDVNYYYWTIKGQVYTKTPVTFDEANDIIVAINNQLSFDFRAEAMGFNEKIKYVDVVHSIENRAHDLIDHVDLEPIEYFKSNGDIVDSKDIKGEYIVNIPINSSLNVDDNLIYNIKLENTPIRPNYLTISINSGEITLKDNGSGSIPNVYGVLQEAGKVDYSTGEIILKLNTELQYPLRISYSKNCVNTVRYTNLSSLEFEVAPECIKSE